MYKLKKAWLRPMAMAIGLLIAVGVMIWWTPAKSEAVTNLSPATVEMPGGAPDVYLITMDLVTLEFEESGFIIVASYTETLGHDSRLTIAEMAKYMGTTHVASYTSQTDYMVCWTETGEKLEGRAYAKDLVGQAAYYNRSYDGHDPFLTSVGLDDYDEISEITDEVITAQNYEEGPQLLWRTEVTTYSVDSYGNLYPAHTVVLPENDLHADGLHLIKPVSLNTVKKLTTQTPEAKTAKMGPNFL